MPTYLNGVEQGGGGGSVGGLYGINVDTLVGDITLTPGTDEIYQYLNPGGVTRKVTLATVGAIAGNRFVIRCVAAFDWGFGLSIYQAAVWLDQLYAAAIAEYIFDGTNWVPARLGTGEADDRDTNYKSGYRASATSEGIAIGERADGHLFGVAIGNSNPSGMDHGVCVGWGADGHEYGASLGFAADGVNYAASLGAYAACSNKKHSVALGYRAKVYRTAEMTRCIDGTIAVNSSIVQGGWAGNSPDDVPIEIFCGEINNERFTIRASSVLTFSIFVVGRDVVAGDGASYKFEGQIKRDNAGNTIMSVCTKAVIHEDDDTWDCDVTADDVNEALIITVTGDATNAVWWSAVLNGVEVIYA